MKRLISLIILLISINILYYAHTIIVPHFTVGDYYGLDYYHTITSLSYFAIFVLLSIYLFFFINIKYCKSKLFSLIIVADCLYTFGEYFVRKILFTPINENNLSYIPIIIYVVIISSLLIYFFRLFYVTNFKALKDAKLNDKDMFLLKAAPSTTFELFEIFFKIQLHLIAHKIYYNGYIYEYRRNDSLIRKRKYEIDTNVYHDYKKFVIINIGDATENRINKLENLVGNKDFTYKKWRLIGRRFRDCHIFKDI